MATSTISIESSFPPKVASAQVIVLERSGRWAAALRGELATGVHLQECRILSEAWDEVAAAPTAFFVAEATRENLDELLRRMVWFSRDFRHARIAVVAAREFSRYEWLLRDAGAVHFTASPRQLGPLAEVISRHLANVPSPPQTLVERIWASLSWGENMPGGDRGLQIAE